MQNKVGLIIDIYLLKGKIINSSPTNQNPSLNWSKQLHIKFLLTNLCLKNNFELFDLVGGRISQASLENDAQIWAYFCSMPTPFVKDKDNIGCWSYYYIWLFQLNFQLISSPAALPRRKGWVPVHSETELK